MRVVVVVYHVNTVASGHGLEKKFGPLVIGCVLGSAGSSYSNYIYIHKNRKSRVEVDGKERMRVGRNKRENGKKEKMRSKREQKR